MARLALDVGGVLILLLASTVAQAKGEVHLDRYRSQAQAAGASNERFSVFQAPKSASSSAWCPLQSTHSTSWQTLHAPLSRTVLGKPDVHTCSVMKLPASSNPDLVYTRTALKAAAHSANIQLYKVLLLDCDASFWQLEGIEQEHVCISNTAALRASCNQWLLTPPAAGHDSSETCAPPGTAFGSARDLRNRVLVLQAHWRISADAADTAVQLPEVQLKLGAVPSAAAVAAQGGSSLFAPARGSLAAAAATTAKPALLGAFVGSGIYPPSSLSHSLQALTVPASTAGIASADLECGKRCTFKPLGRMRPKPVNVVGYSFNTFDRALSVAVEVKRGWAGKGAGPAVFWQQQWQVVQAAGGLVALEQPLQLYPGDIVRWRCSYNTSDLAPGSSINGGYSSSSDAQQEQCTVELHYWPRVESMRGCTAATLNDKLLGENMCSREAEDLLEITGTEGKEFPMRRMYNEHSFPKGSWMGAWKATHMVLLMAIVWSVLWASHTILSSCKALGNWHRRFHQLAPGQQRNVSLYITHLILDTVALLAVSKPMIELWLGLSETTADVQAGVWGFTYLVSCYALELTWRRSIDTMLAVHHIGTITIILLFAGELTPYTYRVANNIIVLAAFALLEQPTYIALLFKRMLPAHSPAVVAAARIGYISWFVLKALSIVLAATMFWEDWHLMPTWIRVNFLLTWIVASVVQGWSGMIQYGIYKQILRSYLAATWQQQHGGIKRRTAAAVCDDDDSGGSEEDGAMGNLSLLLTPIGSDGSEEDCIAAVDNELLTDPGDFAKYIAAAQGTAGAHSMHCALDSRLSDLAGFRSALGGSNLTAAVVRGLGGGEGGKAEAAELSPRSSDGSGSGGGSVESLVGQRTSSRGSGRQVRLPIAETSSERGGDADGVAGSSSGAKVYRSGALQRRTKSGLLNMMECGIASNAGLDD